MAVGAKEMHMRPITFLSCIQSVFYCGIVDDNAVYYLRTAKSLHSSIKSNPVVHLAHFSFYFIFCHR